MSGPREAYRDTECEICADVIEKGEPIFFSDDGKLCKRCGELAKIVCPQCGGQKRTIFPTCRECARA